MTDEQKAAIGAANLERAKARREREENSLKVGNYRIFQSDEDNIVLQKVKDTGEDDGDQLYFPTVKDALMSSLHRQINAAGAKTVKELLFAIQKAEANCLKALVA